MVPYSVPIVQIKECLWLVECENKWLFGVKACAKTSKSQLVIFAGLFPSYTYTLNLTLLIWSKSSLGLISTKLMIPVA